MARTSGQTFTNAGTYARVGDGYLSFDIIFSADFVGTVDGQAYTGAVSDAIEYPYVEQKYQGTVVVLTSGSFQIEGSVG